MRKPFLLLIGIVLVLALGLIAAGCPSGGGGQDEETTTTTTTKKASDDDEGGAKVEFTSPAEGETVDANVTAEVEVENFEIVDKIGDADVTGEGHVHYYVDSTTVYTPGLESFKLENLATGEHTLIAELHTNSHALVTPPARAIVKFSVGEEGASGTTGDAGVTEDEGETGEGGADGEEEETTTTAP